MYEVQYSREHVTIAPRKKKQHRVLNFSEYQNVEHCPPAVNRAVRTVKEAAVNELMRTNRTQRAFVNPTYHTVKEEPNHVFFDIFKKHISLRIRFNCAAAQSLRLFCGKFRHRA